MVLTDVRELDYMPDDNYRGPREFNSYTQRYVGRLLDFKRRRGEDALRCGKCGSKEAPNGYYDPESEKIRVECASCGYACEGIWKTWEGMQSLISDWTRTPEQEGEVQRLFREYRPKYYTPQIFGIWCPSCMRPDAAYAIGAPGAVRMICYSCGHFSKPCETAKDALIDWLDPHIFIRKERGGSIMTLDELDERMKNGEDEEKEE